MADLGPRAPQSLAGVSLMTLLAVRMLLSGHPSLSPLFRVRHVWLFLGSPPFPAPLRFLSQCRPESLLV